MTLKVIHRLHAFSNAIRRTFVQHFIRFQLTVYLHRLSALAELLVISVTAVSVAGKSPAEVLALPLLMLRHRAVGSIES